MSAPNAPAAEHVCYVHCNFCNTVLAVSVPGNSMLNIVTVRCGHCTNLLSVNLRGLMHSAPAAQDHFQESLISGFRDQSGYPEFGSAASSSNCKHRLPAAAAMVSYSQQNQQLQQALHVRRKSNFFCFFSWSDRDLSSGIHAMYACIQSCVHELIGS
ncbi:hypothetical protein GUJ93_ZPchr0012g19231 [Zizania palustris]|uniref:YABBY N-terminal domain-containing protein n=1 Tax=Zizania palustris TaxID=103762 RepID=A0A8J5WPN7_ZIZPA|nr:hypothetical protein GUJ93_ZPchr0012g19231 [Zizania palustris]KAG8092842.1 hypothetical protein GUJ93_ZPchr0012g19231 [Zizania palustris]